MQYPKPKTKKKRKHHPESILQSKADKHCFLCQLLQQDYSEKYVHTHHVFYGTANREHSEEYGLTVNLCVSHHELGKDAVHANKTNDLLLKRIAQQKFEQNHTRQEFIQIFGRSWL